jgi:hypothetical protein
MATISIRAAYCYVALKSFQSKNGGLEMNGEESSEHQADIERVVTR